MARKQTRKLVGFKLDAKSKRPKEGHLVLASNIQGGHDITGNVTSSEFSSTLNANIGMAFVGINQQEIGSYFPIRVDDNQIVMAEVVPLPFYDVNNDRQEVQ